MGRPPACLSMFLTEICVVSMLNLMISFYLNSIRSSDFEKDPSICHNMKLKDQIEVKYNWKLFREKYTSNRKNYSKICHTSINQQFIHLLKNMNYILNDVNLNIFSI